MELFSCSVLVFQFHPLTFVDDTFHVTRLNTRIQNKNTGVKKKVGLYAGPLAAQCTGFVYPNLTTLVLYIGLVTTWGYTCLIRIHQKRSQNLVRPDWHTLCAFCEGTRIHPWQILPDFALHQNRSQNLRPPRLTRFEGIIHSTFHEGIIHSTFYEGILRQLFIVRFMKELFMIFFKVRFMKEFFRVGFMKESWRNYS